MAKGGDAPSVGLDDPGLPAPASVRRFPAGDGFGASLTRPVCKGETEDEPGAEVDPKA